MTKKVNKKLVIVGIIILTLFIIVIINAIYFNIKNSPVLLTTDESMIVNDFEIKVDDYYEADYTWIDALDYNFDKYLAVDLSITNLSDERRKFSTIGHFKLDDGNYKHKSFLVDENSKKFSKDLYPDETFNITLTFPADNATSYTLYYSETLKQEDEENRGFELEGRNLEKKEVEQSVEHRQIGGEDGE